MFKKLQTKVTFLYAALFAVVLGLVAQAVVPTVAANALNATKAELEASRTVFNRLLAMKSRELRDSADLLARDFGFRSAVATGDAATIESALENLRIRRGIDQAFLVMIDGRIIGAKPGVLSPAASGALLQALNDSDQASGVLQINGAPFETISATVSAPQPIGWIVFATKLDRGQMQALERLSAIPLEARLLQRQPDGHWRYVDHPDPRETAALDSFIKAERSGGKGPPRILDAPSGKAVGLISPIQSLGDGVPTALLLRYPIDRALAPYLPLLLSLAVLGIVCLLLMVAGSWALARSITRPLAKLEAAVGRLGKGERAEVEIRSNDEIGRLAHNFNSMSAAIIEREQRITEMALHDVETGLPNRAALEARVNALVDEAESGCVVVIALAIDRIEVLRNAIGYAMVAALMRELGERVGQLRPDVTCARVSTGRLALAMPIACDDTAQAIAEQLLHDLSGPLTLGETTMDVGLTVGMATRTAQEPSLLATQLIEHANIAIDQAHAAHLKISAFDAAAYGDPAQNLSLMSELALARVMGELNLFYQPKYDLRSGAITGMEALCRWRHATRGPISPDLFIVMAEETGHIQPLTEWVLHRALADQHTMRAAGVDLPIAINLSGQVLGDRGFAAMALEAIRQAEGQLTMEITETAVIANPEEALAVIDMFERSGVPVSIDDYGAGLSSLAYLKRIRAQELKIDKAFVLTIDQNPRDRLLVKSTVDLAHGLGMRVVAEGVETAEALALLAGMGCDYAQGYHIARPMPLNDLISFVQAFDDDRLHGASKEARSA